MWMALKGETFKEGVVGRDLVLRSPELQRGPDREPAFNETRGAQYRRSTKSGEEGREDSGPEPYCAVVKGT